MWFLWLRRIIKAFKSYFCSYKHVSSVVWRFHAHCCCNSCRSYNRTGGFDSIRESLQLLFENRQCCNMFEGKIEMFSQFRFRRKDGLATFLYSNFCGLGSSLHCSYWPFIYTGPKVYHDWCFHSNIHVCFLFFGIMAVMLDYIE